MSETIKVKMTREYLYDFLLFHVYSTFMGFLTNILGAAVIIMGIIRLVIEKDISSSGFYLGAGILFCSFTPLQLYFRAARAVKRDIKYSNEFRCEFSDDGIRVAWTGLEMLNIKWCEIDRIVFAPKTLGFYYSESEAIIIPKPAFGVSFNRIMNLAINNTPIGTLKIRELQT